MSLVSTPAIACWIDQVHCATNSEYSDLEIGCDESVSVSSSPSLHSAMSSPSKRSTRSTRSTSCTSADSEHLHTPAQLLEKPFNSDTHDDYSEGAPGSPTPKALRRERLLRRGQTGNVTYPLRSISASTPAWVQHTTDIVSLGHRQRQADIASSAGTSSRASTSASNSKRSQSPSKNPAQLRFAGINTRAMDPEALPLVAQELYADISQISDGIGTIPAAVKDEKGVTTRWRPLRPDELLNDYPLDAKSELTELREIIEQAALCFSEKVNEAHWNNAVHWPILTRALGGSEGGAAKTLRAWNITSARVLPSLVPTNIATGDAVKSRLVDFCLALEPTPTLERLVASQPPLLQTINQTTYSPLVLRPIAVAIETKPEASAESGNHQLATWTKAWMARAELMSRWIVENRADTGQVQNETEKRLPVLPLVRVVGHDWKLAFAWAEKARDGDLGSSMVIMSEMPMGSTSDIVHVYRLLASLRRLALWAHRDFRLWCNDFFSFD